MNPSASGWIDKYGFVVKDNPEAFKDFQDLYAGLKKAGFVYGLNIKIPRFIEVEHNLSEDEKAKINLLTALYYTFVLSQQNGNFKEFLPTIFEFYKLLNIYQKSLLDNILSGKRTSSKLETLINSRVYLDDNLFSKTFNNIITNSLLFIDVLTFKYYLDGGKEVRQHAQHLEFLVINIAYHALNSKEKNKTDEKLSQLFESSLTFIDGREQDFDGSYRDQLIDYDYSWQKPYFMDVACVTVWEDKTLEYKESEFIYGIGKDLGFENKDISRALEEITAFFDKNSRIIPFLKSSNMALQFYDGMSKVVIRLIQRNSKRLQKELLESKELMLLLSKSTVKDLSREEKKKVQNQLLDIFKTIPSLAIFMLPGGAVLLPIFIKLIPRLLPSAFDENRVDKNK
ncbi:MAG: LETM1-related biofilm-associated protein [Flavobacteriaceae bacterium]